MALCLLICFMVSSGLSVGGGDYAVWLKIQCRNLCQQFKFYCNVQKYNKYLVIPRHNFKNLKFKECFELQV